MSEADLEWHQGPPVELDIIGVNYYPETPVRRLRHFKNTLTTERVWAGVEGLEER